MRSRHYAAPLAKTEISRRSRRFPNSDEREKGLFVCVFLNKRIISKTNFIFFFLLGVSRVPRYPTRRAMATRCGLCDSRGGRATCANPNIACTLRKKKNLDFLFQKRGNKKKIKEKERAGKLRRCRRASEAVDQSALRLKLGGGIHFKNN